MGWSLVAHTSDGSPGTGGGTNQVSVITGNIDTTGAHRIFVCVHDYNGASRTATLSDNKSNTWTPVTGAEKLEAGGTHVKLYKSGTSPSVGSGHNFTVTGDGGAPANNVYPSITVVAFANAGTHDEDGSNISAAMSNFARPFGAS